MGQSGPIAELLDVVVRRGASNVLGPLTWTVEPGQRWVVLGANGAGKTTLLQLCAGSLLPTTGTTVLLGERLDDDDVDFDELLPRVGWASAALADQLQPSATVIDVVVTGLFASLARSGDVVTAEDFDLARSELTRVGCRSLADRTFGSLSEGERKRVQLARALAPDPELLLLDEPAAGLDLGGREALLRLLARLAADPAAPAMVMVSHHVEEIPLGFTHALLLRSGRIVSAGSIESVLTSSSLTATFGLPLQVTRSDGRFTARALLGFS